MSIYQFGSFYSHFLETENIKIVLIKSNPVKLYLVTKRNISDYWYRYLFYADNYKFIRSYNLRQQLRGLYYN